MTLASGTRLGPYELSEMLGAGGMGEVYKARDTRLERSVAIKVLPLHLSSNPQLRERFEREARAISSISHPNICALYDVGETEVPERLAYLVMEYLEGESLADRLAKGPLPLEQVLRYGVEIASALDKAHRGGIIHRDLKPGNIMLTRSGAKLLDFGLAKYGRQQAALEGVTSLPTEHRPLTQEGTILGTFQYMAPEQLAGEEADERTDIFALGAVLYEMLTGVRAFQGKNKTSLIGAIVSGEPRSASSLQPLTPPVLEHVIRKCLAKEPDDRWQSAHDIAEALKWVAEAGSQAGLAAPLLTRRRRFLQMAWALHALTAIVAVAITWAVLEASKTPPQLVRTSLLPPPNVQFDFDSGAMALSPDGKRIAFIAAGEGGRRMLWVRSLDALSAQPLAGTEDASYPFWSPDSRFIGFGSGGKLRKIDASGGPPQTLADAITFRGGSWGKDGIILFAPGVNEGIHRVSPAGGLSTRVSELAIQQGEGTHRFPVLLPDGRRYLYLGLGGGAGGIFAGDLGSKQKKHLVTSTGSFAYVSGHLIFWREGTLLAQPFDADSLELKDEPFPIAEDVRQTLTNAGIFSVSDDGKLAFQSSGGGETSHLVWIDREGKVLETTGKPADYRQLRLSNDGRRVAVSINDAASQQQDIWVIDPARSTRLTFDAANDYSPIWSPDDRFVVFGSNRRPPGDIYRKASSGTGTEDTLIASGEWSIPNDVSPDGRWLAYQKMGSKTRTGWDLYLMSLEDKKSRVFLQTPFEEVTATFSPDGKWLAYSSNESGRNEVFVQSLSDSGGKWQVSVDGGIRPRWSRDGSEIFFLSLDYQLMVVAVKTGSTFEALIPRVIPSPSIIRGVGSPFGLSLDGRRVLIISPVRQGAQPPITLVQNWMAAVR